MSTNGVLLVEPSDDSSVWMVARTKPRQERSTSVHLAERAVQPYCPMFMEPAWWSRSPRGPVPLFSSYIFVRCAPRTQLNAIRFCPGIQYPVAFRGLLAAVEDDFVESLRRLESGRGFIESDIVNQRIPLDERVRVMGGPLRGVAGVFKGYLRGGERARVLVGLLRSERMIEVDAAVLRASSR